MDFKGFGFMVCAVALVFGLFAYSQWDQTRAAAAETQLEIRMDRQPEAVHAAEELGMSVFSKVISGVIAGAAITLAVMFWQYLKIRELKYGGWGRYWERRKTISMKQANPKKPRLEDLLLMMLMRDTKRDERK